MSDDIVVAITVFCLIIGIVLSLTVSLYLFETSEAGMYKDCLDSCKNVVGYGDSGSRVYEAKFECIKECNEEFESS